MGRSQKALKNVSTGLVNKAAVMLLSFITKTFFIRLLGAEYNGVNSLYTNILSVLALAELGVGNVLMFYLYSALKEHDEEKIIILTNEFKKIYYIIIASVLTIGLLLVPVLRFLVKSNLQHTELIVYYLLYLCNSVASYFVIYRTMVLRADQKEYIVNNCNTITTIVMYALQLLYLYVFRNFLGYLIIQVICTIGNNLIQNWIAINKYPYLKNKSTKRLEKTESHEIFNNVKATFLFKVSDTILDQTDNIIISVMFGTIMVGYYANYYLIIAYLVQIASIVVSGLIASFGNLYASGDVKQSYKMVKCFMLFFSAFGAFCCACYASVVQLFIPLWVGKEYVMEFDLVIAILAVFYVRMATNTVWMCRSTMGLFKEVQYINLFAAIINIVLSIALGKVIGVSGVIIATAVSRLLTSFWYEGKVVFDKLQIPVSNYFGLQLKHLISFLVIVSGSFLVNKVISLYGIIGIVIRVFVCAAFTLVLEFITQRKTEEYSVMFSRVKALVIRRNRS